MYRKAIEALKNWKNNSQKKALLITGARQIGKTYLVRRFAREFYENFLEINFITQPAAKKIFDKDLDAETLVAELTGYIRGSLKPGRTLIFLDEIQECPNARTAIKFLVEDGRFDYIESGSLLGVHYKHVPSYPVGYEEFLQMYPMDFEEFCLASGVQQKTLDYLRRCYEAKEVVPASLHEAFIKRFQYYVLVGGMPAVVKTFLQTRDVGRVMAAQKDILAQYRQDVTQYALVEKAKIAQIFNTIPAQLDEKTRRFKLSSLSAHARLRDYEEAFLWLKDAGVALPCYNVTAPKIPLKLNEQSRLFKLFLSDCGLLCSMGLENIQFEILQGNLSVNMGSVLENVFAQQLKSNGFDLRFLNKRGVGELDFVVSRGSEVIPIEVKSGKDYHKHAAINNALAVKDWGLKDGLVFCMGNVEKGEGVTYLPWYMVMFFKQQTFEGLKINLELNF